VGSASCAEVEKVFAVEIHAMPTTNIAGIAIQIVGDSATSAPAVPYKTVPS